MFRNHRSWVDGWIVCSGGPARYFEQDDIDGGNSVQATPSWGPAIFNLGSAFTVGSPTNPLAIK
jgi:hypothetical protein